MSKIIAVDIGRSSTKCVVSNGENRHSYLFKSVVCPAFELDSDVERLRAETDTVEMEGATYFTDETAIIHGEMREVSGLHDDWIESREHWVLFKSALQRAATLGVTDTKNTLIILALPSEIYSLQRKRLKELASRHCQGPVTVMSQPMGPYYAHLLSPSGYPMPGITGDESYGVIDVGRFTTDFLVVERGRFNERRNKGTYGTTMIIAEMQRRIQSAHGVRLTELECEHALQTNTIKHFGKMIDVSTEVQHSIPVLGAHVVNKAQEIFNDKASRFDAIIVAGGGGIFIESPLSKLWGNVTLSANSRMSIADGMNRFGQMQAKSRSE